MATRGDELIQSRLDNLAKLQEAGINPYPGQAVTREPIAVARARSLGESVTLAGRMTSWRSHGSMAFADLEDTTGKIQLWFRKDGMDEELYRLLKHLDVGDFIAVTGTLVQTQAGELTCDVNAYTLLTKSIRPIPSEHYGLKDVEVKLRKRYLDLLLNPELREVFRKKAVFMHSVREFLQARGFMEVQTPALEIIPGGAEARPFITHHNALDIDLYLRISLELYQKRLLVGGYEKVFEIGRVFRNEGIDAEHLQDYTQIEFYWAYADYEQLMALTEEMFRYIIEKTFGTLSITSHGHTVDWGKPWQKLDYFNAFQTATGIDLNDASIELLRAKAIELHLPVEANIGKGRLIDLLYKKTVRSQIIEPTHLINHPVAVSPLAKRRTDNPNKTKRVQTLAYGSELSNGFSELNDPVDQRQRFEEQAQLRAAGDQEAQMFDEDFVEALEYGMPPAAGFGMSERVFSYLVDMPMRETVFFPTLRPAGATEWQATLRPQKAMHSPVILNEAERSEESSEVGRSSKVEDSSQAQNDTHIDDSNTVRGENHMTVTDAQKLVDELLQSQNLKNHCYAAGAAMAALYDQFEIEAQRQGTIREDWEITGILHDVDYEVTNKDLEEHTEVTTEKLHEFITSHPEGADQVERIIQAVRGHCDKADRATLMAKAIYAADELTGLIVAAALIRPDKKLEGLTVESVLKRFAEPGFAKGANRDQIKTAEPELDLQLDVFTEIVLDAMKKISGKLGL